MLDVVIKAKRNTAWESIARAARLRPSQAPVSAADYGYVRKHASTFAAVAADCAALLPLLNAYLKNQAEPGRVIRDDIVLLRMKNEILGKSIRAAAWRYVCNNGCGVFEPIWRMSAEKDTWRAAMLYLQALDNANLPPAPPSAVAYGWLRMFAAPKTDVFRMDDSLERIPPAIIRGVFAEADRCRDQLTCNRVDEFMRALIWGEAQRLTPSKTQRRAGWPWINRMARQWEARIMPASMNGFDKPWGARISTFQSDGHRVVPLRTPREMVQHALLMRNCLDEKVTNCRDGLQRYFAVWAAGKARRPVAHIGMGFDSDKHCWVLLDCKGFANAPASPGAWRIAKELERHCNLGSERSSSSKPAAHINLLSSAA